MNSSIKAHLALFTVALIYGANYTIAKIVLDDNYIQPKGFILLRAGSGMILFFLCHHFFIKEKVDRKDIPKLMLLGLFGVAINQIFFFMGLKLTTPINASLIMTTCPIVVLIAGAFFLKERITTKKVIGILIGASGAILLILYGQQINFNKSQTLGDLMILVNSISYGLYIVLVKSMMKKYHPITVVKWVFIFGSLYVLPFGYQDLGQVEWTTFSSSIWIAIAYVLIFTTFLTYLLNTFALKLVQSSIVSIYIYLQPLFATIIALIVGNDQIVTLKVISGFLIFLGVYLVSSSNKFPSK